MNFQQTIAYYHAIALEQKPEILWIGCSDSRVSESIVTDSKPGKIFVHRNIANIVAFNDINIASIVDYADPSFENCQISSSAAIIIAGGFRRSKTVLMNNYIADWLLIAQGA